MPQDRVMRLPTQKVAFCVKVKKKRPCMPVILYSLQKNSDLRVKNLMSIWSQIKLMKFHPMVVKLF